ncbi:hypothetical protein IGI04_000071 [Brassica rapa subsp. trilocularis]|uniref:DUF632 domain-containing protein n=1 Tax=Brassica rapa subsp. trilocularis TaxID=1813537 RepID=A0ABQ7NNP9_BRACM|nr:hypothetical protein IGI04_000071 [Brassica rapa subsp. trilocularis]
MSPSILEKMGCSNSKEASTKKKKNEPLLLCKERKRFVKQAIDSRCALAAAHVSYVRSLRNIGACLRQYAEAETVAAVASSPSHNSSSYPDDDDDGDSVDSPLSHNTKPKPVLSLSYTKSANSTVTYTMNPLDMSELSPPPPPPPLRPRRPETSSWDYFDTCDEFDSFRLTDNASVVGFEKQRKQSNAEDFKTEQRKQSSADEGEREDPSEFITHRAKDFVSSMKDIEHKFFRASESGKEVSRMLEANKIRVGFADTTTGKGNSVAFLSALKRACCRGRKSHSPFFKEPLHQQVTKVIVWKRTSSSRSSTSRNPLIEDHDDEESGSDFTQELIRMWKAMLECHHSQYITISLAYHCRNTSKTGPENALKRRIWLELLEETECFGLSFADLVNSMTSYVEALNGWLHNCVLLPQERSTRNRRPWSPRRVLAPPIFVLCRDWSAGMKSLPSDELSRSIKEFSTDMEMLGEEKEDSVLVSEDLSRVHSSLAKLLERLKKFSEASLKMYEDVKVKSEEAVVAYTNHSNCGRPLLRARLSESAAPGLWLIRQSRSKVAQVHDTGTVRKLVGTRPKLGLTQGLYAIDLTNFTMEAAAPVKQNHSTVLYLL